MPYSSSHAAVNRCKASLKVKWVIEDQMGKDFAIWWFVFAWQILASTERTGDLVARNFVHGRTNADLTILGICAIKLRGGGRAKPKLSWKPDKHEEENEGGPDIANWRMAFDRSVTMSNLDQNQVLERLRTEEERDGTSFFDPSSTDAAGQADAGRSAAPKSRKKSRSDESDMADSNDAVQAKRAGNTARRDQVGVSDNRDSDEVSGDDDDEDEDGGGGVEEEGGADNSCARRRPNA